MVKRGRKPGSSPKLPQCPACLAAGSKPLKRPAFTTDGRVRMTRVVRRGRVVTRPAAWVTCQRRIGQFAVVTCGWSWWTVHPALVFMAKAHPGHQLLRRYQQPQDHPGRGGRGKHAEWN